MNQGTRQGVLGFLNSMLVVKDLIKIGTSLGGFFFFWRNLIPGNII